MLQETFQSNCLCCNTSHTNVARNISKPTVCVVTQVIPMLQETFQTKCLCCNTSHTNVARNISELQHKQLLWNVSCNIGMTCVTTQTVALKCSLQHWYDLCYNTNIWSEMFLATLVWLVLQHKQLVWNVSYNIGMTCVITQTVALKYFLQHWYDLCYNTNGCSELFLTTLVWLVQLFVL